MAAEGAFIDKGVVWKFEDTDTGNDFPTAGRQLGFDDCGWRPGSAKLDLADGDRTRWQAFRHSPTFPESRSVAVCPRCSGMRAYSFLTASHFDVISPRPSKFAFVVPLRLPSANFPAIS